MLIWRCKKIISTVLIVAMIFANNGFCVLAQSVENIVGESEKGTEVPNYYFESEEYQETIIEEQIVEEYETFLEENNPGVFEHDEDEEESQKKSSDSEISEEDFDDETETQIAPEDVEEPEEEKAADEEMAASISDADEEVVEKENKEKENEEEIASLSDVDDTVEEIASNSEVEENIEKEIVASDSDIVEIEVATDSEIIASESEIIATESEIMATESEAKEVLIATVSKTKWKVKKILIATFSSTYVFATESEVDKKARLATNAEVILVDEKGNERLVNVPLKWTLDKKILVNEKISRNIKPKKIDEWRKQYKIDEEVKKNKEVIIATDSLDKVKEKVKEENEEITDKEIIFVTVDEEIKETELKQEVEKIEEIIEETKEDLVEEILETFETINETEIVEIEESIIEPTVADFSSTDIASDSEIASETTEEIFEEDTEEVIDASVSEVVEEDIEEDVEEVVVASEPIIKVDEESLIVKDGIIDKKEFSNSLLNILELESIDLYKVDVEDLANSIVNVISETDNNKNEEAIKVSESEIKTEEKSSLFSGILSLFGFGKKEEVDNEKVVEEADKEETPEEKLLETLKNLNVDVVEETVVDSMYSEQDNMRFGAGLHVGGDHTLELILKNGDAYKTNKIQIDTDENIGISNSQVLNQEYLKDHDTLTGGWWLSENIRIDKKITIQGSDDSKLLICTNGYNITFATAGYIKGNNNQRVIICNCNNTTTQPSTITTDGPEYNVKDRFYTATLSDTYTRYHSNPIIEAPNVSVYGMNKNIIFTGCEIKNDYVGHNAVSRMDDNHKEEDAPETSGGGSILHATKRMKVYQVKFTNNIATRTNGVAINAQLGQLFVESSDFENNVNKTNVGGAIAFNPKATYIYDCKFNNNISNTSGGALYGRVFESAQNDVDSIGGTVIQKTQFINNKAVVEGGAIYFDYTASTLIGSTDINDGVTFNGNIAGVYGGAISLSHTPMVFKVGGGGNYYEFEKYPNMSSGGEPNGHITINHVTFSNNETKKQVFNANNTITDAPVNERGENAGGAIYIDNLQEINANGTPAKKHMLSYLEIYNSILEENIAHGTSHIITFGGENLAYNLNNYGGAVYVKNIEDVYIGETEFTDNRSMTGAAVCAYNSKIDITGGKFDGGKAQKTDIFDDDWSSEETKKGLINRIITSGGGAIYLMDGAKAKLHDDVEISNNNNAFYLDGAEIDLGKSKVHDNVGEYLIGYSNYTIHPSSRIKADETEIIKPYENRIMFSGVDIHKHTFYGPGKNYVATLSYTYIGATSVTKFNASPSNTYLSFKGANSINNNKWYITAASGLTTQSEVTEYCNIAIKSSTSNLKFDLSDSTMQKPAKVNATGDSGGKIGIYYYIEDPDGVDDQIVFDKWTTAECRVFREGGIWTNYFEVDQSKRYSGNPGEYIRLEGWKFYRKGNSNTIRLSPNIFVVKFDSYIEGVEEIDEQYYNYKRDNSLITLATPTEIINGAINIPGKTFIGVLGRDCSETAVASGSYVLWDFNKCKLKAVAQEDDENDAEVMILIYADDDIKVKACGCPNGVPCDHENGVQHNADRGTALSNSEEVKEKNYIMVATCPQLAFKYNNKKTQYVLNKDLYIDIDKAKQFLYGETVLNLNGHTLYYDSATTSEVYKSIFNAKLGSKSNVEEEDATIFIAGKASPDSPRGKIVALNHEKPFINLNGTGVFISNVDIEGISTTKADSQFITGSGAEKDDKQYITLENVTINGVDIKEDFIGGLSKVILEKVKTEGDFKLANATTGDNHAVISLGGDATVTKRLLKVVESDLGGMDDVIALYKNDSTSNDAPTEVIIASSSIHDNKFDNALIDTTNIRKNSTISFIGKNNIKDNTVINGKYLIDATHQDTVADDKLHLVFGDDESENTFSGNTVQDVNGNAILHITKKSDVVFKGINKFNSNKSTGSANKTNTVYQDKDSIVNLGKTGVNVSGNNTKYNWYMENSDIAKFVQVPDTKLKASESKIHIRVENENQDQLIYEKWGVNNLYSVNSSENVFDQDPSYTDEKPNSYKVGRGTESDIYFGNDFVIGEFRYYNYQAGIDERVSGTYNTDIAKNSVQRIKKNSEVVLDMPRIENGNDIFWEGLRTYPEAYSSTTKTYDVSTESRLPFGDIKVIADKNFELSGYKYRNATGTTHMHGDKELWVEARNEGHLQATSSYAFLHNDMTISRDMLYKLEGDFVLCLNGHKLIFDSNIDWLKLNDNFKITICDHEGNDGTITMTSGKTLDGKNIIRATQGEVELSNVKIDSITAKNGSFLKAESGVKVNVENVKLSVNTITYDTTDEAAFIAVDKDAIATYNNIEVIDNHLSTKTENQYVMLMKANTSNNKDYSFPGLTIKGNVVEAGKGSIVGIDGYKNVSLDSIDVSGNTVYATGTPLLLIGNTTGVCTISNATFDGNKVKYSSVTDVSPTSNSANIGIRDFDTFDMLGGTIKNAKNDFTDANNYRTVLGLTLYRVNANIKDVTFEGLNTAANTNTEAIYMGNGLAADKEIVFDNCLFKNCTFNTSATSDKQKLIDVDTNYNGKLTINNGSSFENITATTVIKAQKGEILFENASMEGMKVSNAVIDIDPSSKLIASNSTIKNTTGTTLNVNSDYVELYDTEITGSGGSVPAVKVADNKKLTIGKKVIIKGYTKNVKLGAGAKLVASTEKKIADESEIHLSADTNNYNFFDTWSKDYIEKFNYHDFDATNPRWYYLPTQVFVADDSSKQIYISDGEDNETSNAKVYIGDTTGVNAKYATLIYIDAEVHGTLDAPIEITKQYVLATTGNTRLDRVHVSYLSTSSQYWITPFNGSTYPDHIVGTDNHKVLTNIIVSNLIAGETYKIYLSKRHIHKECGPDSSETCTSHLDGEVHDSYEYDFWSVKENADFQAGISQVPSRNGFSLDADLTINQNSLNLLAGLNPAVICLHGHKLTFEKGAKLTTSNKFVITDCTSTGYVIASMSEATDTFISGSGDIKIYNTTFKSFKTVKPIIVRTGTNEIYFENATFSDITLEASGVNGIIDFGTGPSPDNKSFMDGLYLVHNVATGSSLLSIYGEKTLDSDHMRKVYITNNKFTSKLINITNKASVKDFHVDNNTMIGTLSDAYGALYIENLFTTNDDFTISNNDCSANENSKGGAITVAGATGEFNNILKATFEGNKAYKGGAIYIANGRKVLASQASSSFFKKNEAKIGAAIYAENLSNGGIYSGDLYIPEAVFDGNKSLENGVIAWGGELTIEKMTFKNHTGRSILYNLNDTGTDKLTLSNTVFTGNAIAGGAVELHKTGAVTVKNINEKTKNNTFGSFISVANTSAAVDIKDSVLINDKYVDATIKISTSSNVKLTNLKLTNNRTTNGALSIQGNPVKVYSPMYIAANTGAGNARDIFVNDDNSYIIWADTAKIASPSSKLGFSAAKDGIKVFEKWNSSVIDNYDTPDPSASNTRKYAHTPENSELIYASADAKSKNYDLYKSGEDVYIGSSDKYAEISFICDIEGEEANYLTQKIARNVNTKLDLVNTQDVVLNKQSWDVYKEDGTSMGMWKFNTDVYCNVASPAIAKYLKPHLHNECGYTDCAIHENMSIGTHGIDIEYERIRSVADIEVNPVTGADQKHYFSLEEDLYVDHTLNVDASYYGMCLNGYRLIASGSIANMLNVQCTSRDFIICDCKGVGGFDVKDASSTISGAFVKDASKEVSVYGINVNGVDMSSAYLVDSTKVVVANSTFSNITKIKEDGILDKSTEAHLANLAFINNDTITNSDSYLLNLDSVDELKGNITLIGNKAKKALVNIAGNSANIDLKTVYADANTTNASIISASNSTIIKIHDSLKLNNNITKKSVLSIVGGSEVIALDGTDAKAGVFEGNNNNGDLAAINEGRGGVFYVADNSKLSIATTSTFTRNRAKDGASIYARDLRDDAAGEGLKLTKAIFDNNEITDASGHGVVNYSGYLKLEEATFKNHGTSATELIYAGEDVDNTLYLGKAKFVNNNTNKDAVYINRATDSVSAKSMLTDYDGTESTNNRFTNFINVNSGKFLFDKVEMTSSGNSYTNAIFSIKDTNDVCLDNVVLKDNANIGAAVRLTNAKVSVKGKVVIANASGKNLILDSNSYLKGYETGIASDKLSSDSNIHITAAGAGTKIFDGWNEKNIEAVNHPKYDPSKTPIEYMYTPERSGVFVVDNGLDIYKKGTNSDVYVGASADYITLRFIRKWNDEDDVDDYYPDITLGTQRIAKEKTAVDRVDIYDYEVKYQEWIAPSSSNWKFVAFDGTSIEVDADYTSNQDIYLVSKHIHRVCGNKLTVECDHKEYTGASHDDTPIYKKIASESDPAFTPYVTGGEEYLVLTGDLKLTDIDTGWSKLLSYKGLCLNGHKITLVQKTYDTSLDAGSWDEPKVNPVINITSGEFSICDCKHLKANHGRFTAINEKYPFTDNRWEYLGATSKAGAYFKTSGNGKLNFYNVHFEDLAMSDFTSNSGGVSNGVLIYNQSSEPVYMDHPVFTNIRNAGKHGLFYGKVSPSYEGTGAVVLNAPEFIDNDLSTSNPLIELTPYMTISSMSITLNEANGCILSVKDNENISIGKVVINNNTARGNGVVSIPQTSTLTFTDDAEFIGNTNTQKGVFYVEGKLVLEKGALFENNFSNVQGGALYVKGTGGVKASGSIVFRNNTSLNGATIYGENITENAFDFSSKAVFDNNHSKTTSGAIVEWTGDLKLDNVEFINNVTDGSNKNILIQNVNNAGTADKLQLSNISFINNKLSDVAVRLKNIASPSKISNVLSDKSVVNNGDINTLFDIRDGSAVTFENVDMHGFNVGDSIIKVTDSPETVLSSVSIANNRVGATGGAVYVTSGALGIKDKVVIKDNNSKDVRLGVSAYLKGVGKEGAPAYIDEESRIALDPETADQIVFKGWDKNSIEKYDNPDKHKDPIEYMYTPEGTGMFINKNTAWQIYKSGINGDVKIGANYVTLTFTNNDTVTPKPDDIPLMNFNGQTQNIEKGVATKIDKVNSFEYEVGKQDWMAPQNGNESVTTIWHFPDPTLAAVHPEITDPTAPVVAQYNASHEIIYVYKHIHKICGLTLLTDCDHTYGGQHNPTSDTDIKTVEYMGVGDDIGVSGVSVINNISSSVEYIGLKTDITLGIGESLNIKPTIKGICLNGHSIISQGGSIPIKLMSGRTTTLEICNCRKLDESALTVADGKLLNDEFIKLNNNDEVNIRRVVFDKINTSTAIINAGYATNKIMLEGVTFKETKGVGSNGAISITNPTSYTLAGINFVDNENTNSTPLVTLAQGMTISTVSFIHNTLAGSAFALSGTPVIGSLDVRNNETTGNGIVNIPNGAKLLISSDMVFEGNNAANGGAIYIANGGEFVAAKKATFKQNKATVNGGAIYMEAGAKANFGDAVTFDGNEAVDGSSIYAANLSNATDLTFNSNKDNVFTNEKATGKGVIAWGGNLTIASLSFIGNQSGCTDILANIHVDGTDKLNATNLTIEGNNGIRSAIALNHVGASVIKETKVNGNTFTIGGIVIVNDSTVQFTNLEMTGNTSSTYGALYISDSNNVSSNENMTIKGNVTTGAYGAAITLENVDSFDSNAIYTTASTEKIEITGNKSASGGAVYLKNSHMGVAALTKIVGNTLNNGAARNIVIADGDSYITASQKLHSDTIMGYTVLNKNYKVFEGWNNTNFSKIDNPDSDKASYTPENSGVFLSDAAGMQFYKSGTGDSESIKLGDNFVTLTFRTADKTITYSTQNIEKNVETKLDRVVINHADSGSEKWIAPSDNPTSDYRWIFADGPVTAKYSASQDVVKVYTYILRYTAGSKEGKPGLTGSIVDTLCEYGEPIVIAENPYTYMDPDTSVVSNFVEWRIKSAVPGIPTKFNPGDATKNLSITENGIAILEAGWSGEYLVRYLPNGEKIGQTIAYNDSFNIIQKSGVPISITSTYPMQIGDYNYISYTTEPNGGTAYGFGSTITGNDNEIKLYCNWIRIENNNSRRRGGGSGGGGGGGNGRGVVSSGGMWINGVWVPYAIDPLHPTLPTLNAYSVDAYGNIKAPTGEIVGNVNLGDRVNVDGTFTDVNGNTHLLDGSVRDINGITYNIDGSLSMPDGRIYYADGSIKDKDGTIYHKDGTVTMPDGTVKDSFGLLHRPDGSIVTQDGTIYYTDGSIEYPDGTKVLSDGTIVMVNNQIQKKAQKNTEGTWEYDPMTGGWKFFNVDNITSQKSYYKDQWVLTADKKGESKWYAVDIFGNMVTGWVKAEGEFYYMSPNADTRGELMKGEITIAGKTYKLDLETGKLLDNQIPTNFNVLGAENHRAGIDGYWKINPATGRRQFVKQNKRADGSVVGEELAKGWYMVDGYYYNFNNDGDANTGLIISDGKYYFMESDGHMLEGGERVVDSIVYVFDKATGACRSSHAA